jgi:hypothetical protein
MADTTAKFRQLDAGEIIETVKALRKRIEERFPGSGLGKVVGELQEVAEETIERTRWIQKPHLFLRAAALLLSLAIIAMLLGLLASIHHFRLDEFTNSVQALDASISSVVFIGAAVLFLLSWEARIKRRRALNAIHELRALAHIIDMHQLTKDPETYFGYGRSLGLPNKRDMTPFELNRYLDYCSDGLAMISKIAALYVQSFQDPVVLDAVDDVEDLTAGFSRKIWQKITILDNLSRSLYHAAAEGVKSLETVQRDLRQED